MPGQIVSVPFLSQVEDMDKYLLEYRSLKVMPQNAVNFQQQQQQQQQVRYPNQSRAPVTGNQVMNMGYNMSNGRKKAVGSNSGMQNYCLGKSGPKFGQLQQAQQQQQQSSSGSGFKQGFPQVFYGSANNSNTSLAQQAMPPQVYAPGPAGQQQFMTASSSSSSTPPPRLHVSVSGTSSISSLSGDFDYLLPNDLNGQLLPSVPSQGSPNVASTASCPTRATTSTSGPVRPHHGNMNPMAAAPLGGSYLDSMPAAPSTTFKAEGSISNSNDFINGLPSSLLSDGTASSEFAGHNGQDFMSSNSAAYPGSNTSSHFMMPNSKSWGASNPTSSSNSGSFGIWNNDMSVWS
ncbi:LANO_0F11628g1_1 [Lachancea nothofagi CBS 11611]|uniref:LANO_0F11628g1_1 n=1 Tax=Lachancea nothofagi CBS 11611 TaxID=1266666 RepID=A0A1G4KB09_9SACH|nr:LANO_0F11628g1_1 [Lachancea nothofagi CBS 11611]